MIGSPNEEAIPESQVQTTSGYEQIRVIDPLAIDLLQQILEQLKNINTQLSFVTEEELQ